MATTARPRIPSHDYWATEPLGMALLRQIGARVVVALRDGLGNETGVSRSAVVVFVGEHPSKTLRRTMMVVGYRWED